MTISRANLDKLERENERLKSEVETLRNTKLYKRLIECLENIRKNEYTRKDLGI